MKKTIILIGIVLLLFASVGNAALSNDDLHTYLKFDSNVTDETGNFTYTPTNAQYDTKDYMDGTASWNGTHENPRFAQSSESLSIGASESYSVGCWIKASTTQEETIFAFSGRQNLGNMDDAQTYLSFSHGGGSCGIIANTSSTYADNNWHLFIGVKNGSGTQSIYLDGDHHGTETGCGFDAVNTILLWGTKNTAPSVYRDWGGSMDECFIFRKALELSEVEELYNAGAGTFYPFAASGGATPTNTTNTTATAYEGDKYNYTLTLQNYNITNETTANLLYNGTYYAGTIKFFNSSYVEFFTKTPAAPLVYNNNTNVNLNWYIYFKYANGTNKTETANTETQAVYWNLTAYPRLNITAYDVIAGSYINTFSLNDSTKTLSTTNGDVYFYTTGAQTDYSITIDNSSYEKLTLPLNFTAGQFNTYTFNLYTTNSINFSFYNEKTNTLITDQNFTVEFISDSQSYNYTSNSGYLYVDLISPEDYTIRYQAASYGRIREYLFTLTNRTHSTLTLYALPNSNSTETTVTVYDDITTNSISGAVVYLQRYYSSDNTYKTVAMYKTDVGGKAYFDIEHDNELYKFLVDYPWKTLKLTTEPLYISETTLNLYISTITDATTNFFNQVGISYTLAYDDANNEFDLTYNDASAVATQYCLYLKKWGQYAQTTVNSSCSTSSSGSISIQGLTENITYYGVFTATIDGNEKVMASAWKTLFNDKLNSGTFGIFMTAVLIMLFALMGTLHIIALLFSSFALVFAQLLGIISIGWGGVIVVVISSLILSIILQMKK